MKKLIILVLISAFMLTVLSADKVAILTFEKKDRASDYVANSMIDRDFKDIFKDYENYELIGKKDVKKVISNSGYTNLFYLGKDEIVGLGTELEADILIWGTVTSITSSEFKISSKVLSMKSLDVIAVNFNVKKNSKQRKQAIRDNLLVRMEEFSAGEIEKLIGIAMQHFNSENYPSAEESFKSVLEMDPINIEATFYLGLINFISNDYEAAENYYLLALQIDPGNNDIKNYLSKVYLEQDMSDDAIIILTEIAEDTQDKLIWMRIGKIYAEMEYYDEAQESFENAIELEPEYGNAYQEIGYLLYDQEYYEEAIPNLETAALAFPDDDDIQKKLAYCYKKTGKIDSAIQQYKDIIAEQPDNIRAYMNLANAYTVTEQYNKAIETTDILKDKIPDDPKVYVLYATSYSSIKQYNKAEENAMKALELDSSLYQPFRILSDIYFAKGYIKYENFLILEEESKNAYGTEADELIEKRDSTKLEAHNNFSKAKHYLEEVPGLTQNSSELKYVKSRLDTINQLLDVTQKDFF